jgi:2-oxoacid:acceptor oxidoreductase gamma subunit (pyruvate/2-ketoisovalerate family)
MVRIFLGLCKGNGNCRAFGKKDLSTFFAFVGFPAKESQEKRMLAVRFHGRGGQGAVIASKLLASALFREGRFVQAFPSFGAERTGAPVAAFLRADDRPISLHCQVYDPDHVLVLDPLLVATIDVAAGLKTGGTLLVNATRPAAESAFRPDITVTICDATGIALAHGLGTRTSPIVNTAIVGAFAAATGLVSLDSLLAVIPDLVPVKPEANRAAARDAYEAIAGRKAGMEVV